MANPIDNRLMVVGLKENPEDFARELETQMYGRIVSHESGNPRSKPHFQIGSDRCR
jgi:hypothetical protein